MVILTRRPNEAFIIELPNGEIIKVAVLSVKPNQVRIGTDAPGDMKIVKEERLRDQQNPAWVPPKQQNNGGD
jgi:carbon storage regulator CsrA